MGASILVIDDDERITRMLRRVLRVDDHRVTAARDGREGLELAHQLHPELVILDIMLPGLDGFDICRRLRQWHDAPILMLTALATPDEQVRGLDAGADDYLAKPFAAEVLLARTRALLRRASRHPALRIETPTILAYRELSLHTGTRIATYRGLEVELGATEFRVLCLLLHHPEQILSREQIQAAVWGPEFSATSNVLAVQISSLRCKLEQIGCPPLIHTVRGSGYILRQ